jgi:hypothetical protein
LKRLVWALLAAAAIAGMLAAGSFADNSANAKTCQKDGWKTVVRSDLSGFTSEEQCTSYAAGGGTIVTPSLTLSDHPFPLGSELCYSAPPGQTECSGFLLTGVGLLPGSTVTVHQVNGDHDIWAQTSPVHDDGTFWMQGTIPCGWPIWAEGTSVTGTHIATDYVRLSCN